MKRKQICAWFITLAMLSSALAASLVDAYRDTSREQEILCDIFWQSVTGQKDTDTALRNARGRLRR